MQKIDDELLYTVHCLNVDTVDCIVWAFDNKGFLNLQEKFKKDILASYPFILAIALKVKISYLSEIAALNTVCHISSVQKFSILLNKSRTILGVEKLHKKGILGSNVTVAVIDTGCYFHVDFVMPYNRILQFVDFVNHTKTPYDDNGHGTFVCGVVGGGGVASAKKYRGIAPNCNIIVLKALDENGQTKATTILDAMQWVFDNKGKYNIRVVCLSFGSEPLKTNDPLVAAVEVLWDSGICVVAASGNDGPKQGTIKSPGASPKIITVGSADTTGDDISVAPFSSRGPAFSFVKPDIIAPGVDILSTTNSTRFYTFLSGTSVSTPMVAGVCALLLEEYKFLSPNQIKNILLNSAQKVEGTKNDCGFGLVDAFNSMYN